MPTVLLRGKRFQLWLGGRRHRAMHLATVDWATLDAQLEELRHEMRGAPHCGSVKRSSSAIRISQARAAIWAGAPRARDFQRQYKTEAVAVPARSGSRVGRSTTAFSTGRAQPINPNEDQPIEKRQLRPRGHPAAQDVQLVSENDDLSFKLSFGPELCDNQARQVLQTIDHPASRYPYRGLNPLRMKFAVGTRPMVSSPTEPPWTESSSPSSMMKPATKASASLSS